MAAPSINLLVLFIPLLRLRVSSTAFRDEFSAAVSYTVSIFEGISSGKAVQQKALNVACYTWINPNIQYRQKLIPRQGRNFDFFPVISY